MFIIRGVFLENKIFVINPLADVELIPFKYFWNDFMAPPFLQDILEQKGVYSELINLNELFIKSFYGEFYDANRLLLKKRIFDFENNNQLTMPELRSYYNSKFLDFYLDSIKEDNLIETAKGVISDIPRSSFLLMDHVDILQGKVIVPDPVEPKISKNLPFFNEVMLSVLKKLDFNNSLVVFSIPSKLQMNTVVQTGKLIKQLFSNVTILIGGSYVNLMKKKQLDDLVLAGVIDIYIDDSNEGKLLNLSKRYQEGSLGDFKGNYLDEDKLTINDLIKTKITNPNKESLLLSKGCYWAKCRYCEFPAVCGTFAIKKIDVILDEIEYFYNKGVKNFQMITDCVPPVYANKIAKGIIERGLDLTWDCIYLRIDPGFTKEVLSTMKESGFDFEQVIVGLETAFDGALETINKGYTFNEVKTFFDRIRDLGIVLRHVNIIMDLPGTTYEGALFVKDFCLTIFDLAHGILAGNMYLSTDSEFGKNPQDYGITLNGEIDQGCRDSFDFKVDNALTYKEKGVLMTFYDYLRFLKRASLTYKIDLTDLAKNSFYNESKIKLSVKFPSVVSNITLLFDESGLKNSKTILVPPRLRQIIPEMVFIIEKANLFEKNKWYSVNQITEKFSELLSLNKPFLRQKIFYNVVALLDGNYFDDVKIEKF